tara:strand:+ start:8853 stop:9644 length:792 start_codon:yes stop_codon:yes gene_type:complete
MKNTFLALALSAAFIGCEKPNRSPIIKDMKLNDTELGAEVNVGQTVTVSVVAEDDNDLARYQVNLAKGAVNEASPVTHSKDYTYGNGDNISGTSKTFSIPVAIPFTASPGAYNISLEVKDGDGKSSVVKSQTLNVVNPDNSISIDIESSNPGPSSANTNIIFTSGAKSITIYGEINSVIDIASVKFFLAGDNYTMIEKTFDFPASDNFTIDFEDIIDEGFSTQYKPLIPANVNLGQQLEFIITAVDANGTIASKAYGIYITTN